ncbi:hypothetical protein AB0B51_37475, partial [Streptomyces griseus]
TTWPIAACCRRASRSSASRAVRTEELAQARRVVDAVAAADGGIAVLDGNMVGPPFARLARTTVARDDAWTSRFGRAGGTA